MLLFLLMRVVSKRTLVDFWSRPGRADAMQPLSRWLTITKGALWHTSADLKAAFITASPVGGNRFVFNIGGNKYRLIAEVWFRKPPDEGAVYIKFLGTHAQYDKVDAATVSDF